MGECRSACDQEDRLRITKDLYCEKISRNLGYRITTPSYSSSTNQSTLSYRIDLYTTFGILLFVHLPYSVVISNVPYVNKFGDLPSLAQASYRLITANSGRNDITFSEPLQVISNNTNGNATILVFDILQNYYLLSIFNSSSQTKAISVQYQLQSVTDFITSFTNYFEVFFLFSCSSSSCRFNMTFDGTIQFLTNERTIIFNATFPSIQSYELYRNFTGSFLARILGTNSSKFSLKISGTYSIAAPNRYVFSDTVALPTSPCSIPGCINCVNSQYCLSCETGYYLSSNSARCQNVCPQQGSQTLYEARCMCLDNNYCTNKSLSRCEKITGTCTSCENANDCSHLATPGLGIFCNNGVCTDCGQNCPQCTSLSDCSKCDYPLQSINGTCTIVCEAGLVKISSIECEEKCGDGIRAASSTKFCDDGNRKDGDGCSTFCSVEDGWKCSGGGPTSADQCFNFLRAVFFNLI